MEDTTAGFRYPPGTRPFHAPLEFRELDAPWSKTMAGAITITIDVSHNGSRKQALEAIYHKGQLIAKEINIEALEHKKQTLEEGKKKAVFFQWHAMT
jgi:hypothetical protein